MPYHFVVSIRSAFYSNALEIFFARIIGEKYQRALIFFFYNHKQQPKRREE